MAVIAKELASSDASSFGCALRLLAAGLCLNLCPSEWPDKPGRTYANTDLIVFYCPYWEPWCLKRSVSRT
jgi:hypothetical protein